MISRRDMATWPLATLNWKLAEVRKRAAHKRDADQIKHDEYIEREVLAAIDQSSGQMAMKF